MKKDIRMTQREFEILDKILMGKLHGTERLAVIAAIDNAGFTIPKSEGDPNCDKDWFPETC